MSDPLKIGFLSTGDAENPRTWSGTVYHMAEAMKAHGGALEYLGPMDMSFLKWDNRIMRLRRRLGLRTGKPERSPKAARNFARQIETKLTGLGASGSVPDFIFGAVGSVLVSELKPGIPVAYSSDATARIMQDYYPRWQTFDAATLAQLEALEQAAIDRADLLFYPTEWAGRSAIEHYGADPAKVHILPLGANLPAPARDKALAARPDNHPDGPLHLVFVGVDWERKGGPLAVATLDQLNARGITARMTVVGCVPPQSFHRDGIEIIPFLDKNNPEERDRLAALYLSADFLILPTRQEAFGIVFCEAAAHGVPSIATATGGVPEVVIEGETGKLLDPLAEAPDWAEAIEALLSAPGGLAAARERARDDFEARLNWDSWGKKALELMQNHLRSAGGQS